MARDRRRIKLSSGLPASLSNSWKIDIAIFSRSAYQLENFGNISLACRRTPFILVPASSMSAFHLASIPFGKSFFVPFQFPRISMALSDDLLRSLAIVRTFPPSRMSVSTFGPFPPLSTSLKASLTVSRTEDWSFSVAAPWAWPSERLGKPRLSILSARWATASSQFLNSGTAFFNSVYPSIRCAPSTRPIRTTSGLPRRS